MKIYPRDLGGPALQDICSQAVSFEEVGYDHTAQTTSYNIVSMVGNHCYFNESAFKIILSE